MIEVDYGDYVFYNDGKKHGRRCKGLKTLPAINHWDSLLLASNYSNLSRKDKMSESIIKSPDQLEVPTTIQILLYGEAGSGKSTLGSSLGRTVMLDTDSGIHRMKKEHQPHAVQARSMGDCEAFLKDPGLVNYDTVVIDTVGRLLEFCLAAVQGGKTETNQAVWTKRNTRFRAYIAGLVALGKNIVFIAHHKEDTSGDIKECRPDISQAAGAAVYRDLDLIGFCHAGKNGQRLVSFTPCDMWYGKNSLDLAPLLYVPVIGSTVDGDVVKNDFLSQQVGKYHEGIKEDNSKLTARDLLVAKYEKLGKEAKTPEDMDDIFGLFKSDDHILDSKQLITPVLKAVRIKLGFEYDKKAKKYFDPKAVVEEPVDDDEGEI